MVNVVPPPSSALHMQTPAGIVDDVDDARGMVTRPTPLFFMISRVYSASGLPYDLGGGAAGVHPPLVGN